MGFGGALRHPSFNAFAQGPQLTHHMGGGGVGVAGGGDGGVAELVEVGADAVSGFLGEGIEIVGDRLLQVLLRPRQLGGSAIRIAGDVVDDGQSLVEIGIFFRQLRVHRSVCGVESGEAAFGQRPVARAWRRDCRTAQ